MEKRMEGMGGRDRGEGWIGGEEDMEGRKGLEGKEGLEEEVGIREMEEREEWIGGEGRKSERHGWRKRIKNTDHWYYHFTSPWSHMQQTLISCVSWRARKNLRSEKTGIDEKDLKR
ncbi:hypothetical protein Pcinc_005554 [Petrolisthes cinctipes]|uniref:Uncharacterized protein n=1 Tax=Petrolisthes cinctipes TaxID=88211 RepID=A0AAE1GCE6_PETCI|nr:hypothetical protein Pcinc_005554 [Petrolisthes cinctipes]